MTLLVSILFWCASAVAQKSTVTAVAQDEQGRLLIGSTTDNYLLRKLPNGQIDYGFPAGGKLNGPVRSLILDDEGAVIVAGDFTQFGETQISYVARFLPNGMLDQDFAANARFGGKVSKVIALPDGRIACVGEFTRFGTTALPGIAVITRAGSADPGFRPQVRFNGPITAASYDKSRQALVVAGGFSLSGFVLLDLTGEVVELK
jgi:hypothetical protein